MRPAPRAEPARNMAGEDKAGRRTAVAPAAAPEAAQLAQAPAEELEGGPAMRIVGVAGPLAAERVGEEMLNPRGPAATRQAAAAAPPAAARLLVSRFLRSAGSRFVMAEPRVRIAGISN